MDVPELFQGWRAGCEGLDESMRRRDDWSQVVRARSADLSNARRATEGSGHEQERGADGSRGHGDLDHDGCRFRKSLCVGARAIDHDRSVQERAKQPQGHGPAAPEDRSTRSQNTDQANSQRASQKPPKQQRRLDKLAFPRLTGEQPHVQQGEPTTDCDRYPADHRIIVVVLSRDSGLAVRD